MKVLKLQPWLHLQDETSEEEFLMWRQECDLGRIIPSISSGTFTSVLLWPIAGMEHGEDDLHTDVDTAHWQRSMSRRGQRYRLFWSSRRHSKGKEDSSATVEVENKCHMYVKDHGRSSRSAENCTLCSQPSYQYCFGAVRGRDVMSKSLLLCHMLCFLIYPLSLQYWFAGLHSWSFSAFMSLAS